jgi:acyl-CoA thioester hydrolase
MNAKYSFTVRWGDTDAAAIVFYPNFYKWMNEATQEFMKNIGYSCSTLLAEQNISVPLVETHCVFKRPLVFEDQVVVNSSVEEIHNKVFKIKHIFVKEEQVVAEGYEIRAWTSFDGKPKAVPIPNEIRERMMPQIETVEG